MTTWRAGLFGDKNTCSIHVMGKLVLITKALATIKKTFRRKGDMRKWVVKTE